MKQRMIRVGSELKTFVRTLVEKQRASMPLSMNKDSVIIMVQPGDERMMSGSILELKRQGAKVHLIYLTHGESGDTGSICEVKHLKEVRKSESDKVKRILGVDSCTLFHFPHQRLQMYDPKWIEEDVKKQLQELSFEQIISFDLQSSYYQTYDYLVATNVAKHLKEHFQIAAYCQVSPHAPWDKEARSMQGVQVGRHCFKKKDVLIAHQSQWRVFQERRHPQLQVLYYALCSKEYFR